MNFNNIAAGALILGATIGLTSCNDFLDLTPSDRVSEVTAWSTVSNANRSADFVYSYFWDVASFDPANIGMTEALTDMFMYGSYNNVMQGWQTTKVTYGRSHVDAGVANYSLGTWGSGIGMTGIRKVNQSLAMLKKNGGSLPEADKLRLEGEIRLVRAFLYSDLIKRYHQVIIYDEDLSKMTDNRALDTEEAAWDFVQADLEFAAANLPTREKANGRANCGQAWAIMSRSMLYAERWDLVKKAAEEVEALGYSLEDNYADAYSKPIYNGNNEAILQYFFNAESGNVHSFDYTYSPAYDFVAGGESGVNNGVPTQELVESYEYATGGFPDWSTWHAEGVTETPPYADLEPRFHATVLYNGAQWKGREIESFVGGCDGFFTWKVETSPLSRSHTGYFLRKLVDESHDFAVLGSGKGTTPITIIRYGEVLLNKAEACFRLGDNAGANEAISAIRGRVGLPYSDKSGKELWDVIRHERKVELAFEGHQYWDLRRWKDASKPYPEGLCGFRNHGLRIEQQANGSFVYNYITVDEADHLFEDRMYQLPLPEGELNSNSLVEQFPQWK